MRTTKSGLGTAQVAEAGSLGSMRIGQLWVTLTLLVVYIPSLRAWSTWRMIWTSCFFVHEVSLGSGHGVVRLHNRRVSLLFVFGERCELAVINIIYIFSIQENVFFVLLSFLFFFQGREDSVCLPYLSAWPLR